MALNRKQIGTQTGEKATAVFRMHIQKWIALNRKKLYRFAFAPNRDPPSTRTDSPLLSRHRLTHDKCNSCTIVLRIGRKEIEKRIFSFLLPYYLR
jgi:hypothetical protein